MSLSTEHRAPSVLRNRSHRPEPASPAAAARPSTRLYRVVWRWHFYAGLIVAPVLIVLAATGALYIFKDELERVIYAELMFVEPVEQRSSIDAQLAAATSICPEGCKITQFDVPADATRASTFYATGNEEFVSLFVDPYSGQALGAMGRDGFFDVVLTIHRTLFAGTSGRIVVELGTCWTIVLLITGLYLWWPRKREWTWGAFLPRLRRHPYVALRDLHAVCGFYAVTVALLIASTGLLYTYFWGRGYAYAAIQSGAYDIFLRPPKSNSSADAPELPLDEIVGIAGRAMPDATLTVTRPRQPGLAYIVYASRPIGPTTSGVTVIDHATGDILMHKSNSQFPPLSWWTTWNYQLHVGAILGLPTKVLWLMACLVLMMLPVTGVWMWWQRRPRGKTGFPRRLETRVPRWLAITIAGLCFVLPALGASVLAIIAGEQVWWRLGRRRATGIRQGSP